MNLRKRGFITFKFVLCTHLIINAQSVHVGGTFPTIDHSGKISNKVEYSLYYFAAFPHINFDAPNLSKDSYFHLFYSEQALTYQANNKFSSTGSYVYQRANVVYDNYVNENRFYLQAKYKHSIKKINLTHRFRFDGRFVHNRTTNETPFTHRVRYLIGLDTPINKTLYLNAYQEAFFNTVKNSTAFFEENWAYAAIGKKLNERNKIEAGILYVTWSIGKTNWFHQYYFQLTWISHICYLLI